MDERLKFDILRLSFETVRDNKPHPHGLGMYAPTIIDSNEVIRVAKKYLTFIEEN